MPRHVGAEHGDAVVVGEGEDLVVVHDGVEVLDPDGLVRVRGRVRGRGRGRGKGRGWSRARARARGRGRGRVTSTGPSSTSHVKFFLSLFALRHSCAKMPSVHSLATTSSEPNIWGAVIALGFMRSSRCGCPTITGRSGSGSHAARAACKISTIFDLPTPDGPTIMSECRTSAISCTWMILSNQEGCGSRSYWGMVSESAFSTTACFAFSAAMPG